MLNNVELSKLVDKGGKNNPSWKGGKQNILGYTVLSMGKGKRKFEHRIVMEKFLDRKLTSQEKIHHINGIKTDNRIENLRVVTQSEHIKIHISDGTLKNNYWKGKKFSLKHRANMMGKRKTYAKRKTNTHFST